LIDECLQGLTLSCYSMRISGYLVDIPNRKITPGIVHFKHNRIDRIENSESVDDQYILPGFIDAHVHIESSMLVPSEFARLAVPHGTVATISDPHEIGNVLGVDGVKYMIDSGNKVNFKFFFGAPSCVPATVFETAGAKLTVQDIEVLFKDHDVKYLAEMMNWPGVLNKDEEVYAKLALAKKYKRNIDGHAPGLKGEDAKRYIDAGISTDHECYSKEEALDKLKYGMKVIIREGSAAKNFDELIDLMNTYSDNMMFCSDDKHPDNLVEGHINVLVRRAIGKGIDFYKVLKAACINPVEHYGLEVGLLKNGDFADFIVVNNLKDFQVSKTYINGQCVAEDGKPKINSVNNEIINNFNVGPKRVHDFQILAAGSNAHVIEALNGQIITRSQVLAVKNQSGHAMADSDNDMLKITVVNRYEDCEPSVAFIKNFGLKEGAIASSVAHDSHNIIAVGVDDDSLCKAINMLIEAKGGICAVTQEKKKLLSLPVAGIMTTKDGYEVAKSYTELDKLAKEMGSKLDSPFMTLSFMALLVIPSLKLSDLGLFDGEKFTFRELFVNE